MDAAQQSGQQQQQQQQIQQPEAVEQYAEAARAVPEQRRVSRTQSSVPANSVLQGIGDRQLPGPTEAPAGARQRGGLKHFMVRCLNLDVLISLQCSLGGLLGQAAAQMLHCLLDLAGCQLVP